MSHVETVMRDAIDSLGLPVHVSDRSFVIQCPACSKQKKYYIERSTGRSICFSCGVKASAAYSLHLLLGCSLEEARDQLNWGKVVDRSSIPLAMFDPGVNNNPTLDPEPLISLGANFPRVNGGDLGSLYAIGRGARFEDLRRLDCRYNTFMQRLVFPVYTMMGEMVGWQGRDWTGKAELKALSSSFSKSRHLLGVQLVPEGSPIAVCEGPFDMLRLMQVVPAVCSFGKFVSDHQISLLKVLNPSIVYVCLDNDAPIEAMDLAFKLGSIARLTPPPPPYKDYGECPIDEIRSVFDRAVPYSPLSFLPDLFV